jgi:hypothetical protein
MNITNINGKITVNGKTYKGNDVYVRNNEIYIDGKMVDKATTIQITINGNVGEIDNGTGDITINGNVTGNISNDVGDIKCGNVGGNVSNDVGDIECCNVEGKASTCVGDVKRKKILGLF